MKHFNLNKLFIFLFACLCIHVSSSFAQTYSAKPIRLIVPVPAGSGPDSDARFIASRLAPILGQPVIIDNRPGAGSRIAIEAAIKSAPDGYTLLFGTPTLATVSSLYSNWPYELKRDLMPVSLLAITAYALTVNTSVPAQTAAAYVTLAKSNPAYSNVATYGTGTITHLAGAWFGTSTGSDFKFIHYNTTTPFNDLLAGQTSAIFDSLLAVIGHVKAGKLRVLAVTGKTRNPLMPDVPTFTEAGFPDYEPQVWNGILAPAGTPRAIIDRLASAIAQVSKQPEVTSYRRGIASESASGTPEEFAAFLEAERTKWGAVVKQSNIKLE
ncbi:MAG: tripartite tricarboxylate transporter substrate-binding protein [Betaproteobacteria bacterium]